MGKRLFKICFKDYTRENYEQLFNFISILKYWRIIVEKGLKYINFKIFFLTYEKLPEKLWHYHWPNCLIIMQLYCLKYTQK